MGFYSSILRGRYFGRPYFWMEFRFLTDTSSVSIGRVECLGQLAVFVAKTKRLSLKVTEYAWSGPAKRGAGW
jgi:hypothetical protein